ncbi:hypothetical protein GTY81_35445 [Streptomyces sp. SID8366]|uniref:hypothetical protein n=1 Tax=unclassified Streptomyces TaxID=2593676 RepID=UPI000DC25E06|nr:MULTISPECIES: hypothetical protein [unclassified Streptomyces]MYU09072.1 hypothetical protein [Streptomyces sp. SID8366]MYU64570.1 hypothetical protein [Streptomyces sp. SID69]RAJ50996.1 hypothetical protein K376_06377 [Streptomyces sp. PsTaAH-130]
MRHSQRFRVRTLVSAVCAAAIGAGLLLGAGAVSGGRDGALPHGDAPGLIKSLE